MIDASSIAFDGITKTYTKSLNKITETVEGLSYDYSMTYNYDTNGYYTGTSYSFITPEQVDSDVLHQSIGRSTSIKYSSYLQGEISRESDGEYVTEYSYDDGFLSQVTHSIGEERSYNTGYAYNDINQVVTASINGNSYNLGYDNRGYIAEVNYNGYGYMEYEYDNAGRLTKDDFGGRENNGRLEISR